MLAQMMRLVPLALLVLLLAAPVSFAAETQAQLHKAQPAELILADRGERHPDLAPNPFEALPALPVTASRPRLLGKALVTGIEGRDARHPARLLLNSRAPPKDHPATRC